MAQETKVEEARCSLQTFERNRYFYGKPMTVSDFEAEQRYLIGKHRYINRLVHGAGVLCGLQVTVPTGFSIERPTVEVAEGAALDCCGNLIVNGRASTVEVKGDYNPEGLNYLYIKYTECSKQPVKLATNGSSCEEVCCYNRIQETFEIVASRTEPGADTSAEAAALTKAAASSDNTDPEAACRALVEQYYQQHLKTCPGCDDPLVFLAVLNPEKGELEETETARYRSLVFNNSMLHDLLCDLINDYSKHVVEYDKHLADFNNPHQTTAEQVRALQSVNGVGNSPARPFVANIDLRSNDNTIGITPNKNANRVELLLAANAVKPPHLHEDLLTHLLESTKSVRVVPDLANKKITLQTVPAALVTSVGGKQNIGASSSYAPEDHVHDLSEGVVERKHLGPDVYANLIQGGGVVKVEPDPVAGTIKVSTDAAPADDPKQVTSVVGAKQLGKSPKYARADHAHDLYINGRSPNESGQFLLKPGANVTIANGAAPNELVISAAAGGGQTIISTGIFVFEDVLPQEIRTSTLIAHRLESGLVAVVLAEEEPDGIQSASGIRLSALSLNARFGDITAFDDDAPFLMSIVDYTQKTIQIKLRDRRPRLEPETFLKPEDEGGFRFAASGEAALIGGTEPPADKESSEFISPTGTLIPPGTEGTGIILDPNARTYRVRWWAIPA
ncbi:MAG TPA: hypothetical protein VF297_27495 [Pyrinomonadaceae bacterium]